MDIKQLESEVRARCPSLAESILSAVEPCIRLVATPRPDDDIRTGASKIGGDPDLPCTFRWPSWVRPSRRRAEHGQQGSPADAEVGLGFLAQIDLADAAATGVTGELPDRGLLSFFADVENVTGLYPSDHDGFRVVWFPDPSIVERRPPPAGVTSHAAGDIALRRALSVPDGSPPPPSTGGFSDREYEELDRIRDELYLSAGSPARHQMLGHPYSLHTPIQEVAVQAAHDLFGEGGFDVDRWQDVRHQAADWRLLLQLDSDDNLGLWWRDSGMVYFAVEREALLADDFDRTWFQLQG